MIKKTFKVVAEEGIHARPATLIVNKADKFKSDVCLCYMDKKINFKSIISVLSLGLFKGELFTLKINGEDEMEAMNDIAALLLELKLAKEV